MSVGVGLQSSSYIWLNSDDYLCNISLVIIIIAVPVVDSRV